MLRSLQFNLFWSVGQLLMSVLQMVLFFRFVRSVCDGVWRWYGYTAHLSNMLDIYLAFVSASTEIQKLIIYESNFVYKVTKDKCGGYVNSTKGIHSKNLHAICSWILCDGMTRPCLQFQQFRFGSSGRNSQKHIFYIVYNLCILLCAYAIIFTIKSDFYLAYACFKHTNFKNNRDARRRKGRQSCRAEVRYSNIKLRLTKGYKKTFDCFVSLLFVVEYILWAHKFMLENRNERNENGNMEWRKSGAGKDFKWLREL